MNQKIRVGRWVFHPHKSYHKWGNIVASNGVAWLTKENRSILISRQKDKPLLRWLEELQAFGALVKVEAQ